MRTLFTSALIAALLPLGAAAQTFRAENFLNVLPLSRTTFEVIEANGEGPRGIWCAAADYASKRLGYYDRIYIREGRGASRSAPGRKGIVFTTDAGSLSQGPSQSISLTTSQVGVGLPVNHAIQFCKFDDYELSGIGIRLR